MHDIAIARFVELGLTRNEALAYVTLLEDAENGGLTGYEVAARSGIPRSAVYTVLRRLELSGAAFAIGSDPARYAATDPNQYIQQIRSTTEVRLKALSDTLGKLPKRSRPQPVWIINRYEDVMARIETMMTTARRSVYLSLWPRELHRLRSTIQVLGRSRLDLVLHSPAPLHPLPAGFSCWVARQAPDEEGTAWSHKALVVVDRREAIIGGTEPHAQNQAVWTTNTSLVDVATNAIILDITLIARSAGLDCNDVVAPMMRPHLAPPEMAV